jgi:hypothetical protein
MIVRSIRTALVMSMLWSLGACVGQDSKNAVKAPVGPDRPGAATGHSIPLALWVDDVVDRDTNETAQPVELDTELADTEDARAFDHYFTK